MTASKPPGPARKHHYLPECYLKAWTGSEGRLVQFSAPHGEVAWTWKAPGGTGYEPDLYSMPALGPAADWLESRLMKMIDTAGARSLEHMRSGNALDADGREAFAGLLATLQVRTPPSIHALKRQILEWRRADRPDTQVIYERFIWQPGMPDRAADHMAETDTAEEQQTFLAETFAELLRPTQIISHLTSMAWRTLTLPRGAPRLLTSDHPVIVPTALDRRDSLLLLPISPTQVFVAANSRLFLDRHVTKVGLVALAHQINETVVGRARRFAYGSAVSQHDFVKRWWGKARIPTIGEIVASRDPWGHGRPPWWTVEDTVDDYIRYVAAQVENG